MNSIWQDIWRLLSGPGLFRLGTLQTRRLIPVLYAAGLAAIGLWAVDHLLVGLSLGFGLGLWAIVEIVVFGAFMVLALRVICEVFLNYFNVGDGALDREPRIGEGNLLDEVRDAIHDLAEDDDDGIAPATDPAPYIPDEPYEALDDERPRPIKRTARRSIKPRS